MSHAPIKIGAQGRTQTFNLWFVGPALHQLSYSGFSLVVGVGFEPTSRIFQTRANPSQLPDQCVATDDTDYTDETFFLPVKICVHLWLNDLAGMTRLELANQLIEGQPAFHFAFIPMVHLRVERFELITCADFKSAASACWATRA